MEKKLFVVEYGSIEYSRCFFVWGHDKEHIERRVAHANEDRVFYEDARVTEISEDIAKFFRMRVIHPSIGDSAWDWTMLP